MTNHEENLKKINDELEQLSDEDLENIVGGANGYIYYGRTNVSGANGYHLVFSKEPMTKEEVTEAFHSKPIFMQPFVDYKDSKKFFDDAKAKGYEVIDLTKMKE